jgi:hypothetical protein
MTPARTPHKVFGMRGDAVNSGLRTGVALSVILHAGVAFLASTVPVEEETGEQRARLGALNSSLVSFDFADPLPETPSPPAAPEQRQLTTLMVEPEPIPRLTPEELERKLVLGIDESTQKTPNWMGFADPTEHKALLSEVEQPLLDPNPGTPGAPSTSGVSQSGPQTPMTPNSAPAEEVAQPSPPEMRPAREGPKAPETAKPAGDIARNGSAEGVDQPGNPQPRPGEDRATGDKLALPARGIPDPTRVNPNLPGPKPEERGHTLDPALEPPTPNALKPEVPKKIEATKESAPTVEILSHPETVVPPAPGTPNTTAAAAPTAPMPAGGPSISSVPGATGTRPGEKSPKESDASSTTPTVEIRPGKPAAAQGLDITTKRPIFTSLTRVTAYPQQNPLLKVTFNRAGLVSKVLLVESSGAPDVDSPIVNSVYQWTAKGKLLAEISPTDPTGGITVSFRILLR